MRILATITVLVTGVLCGHSFVSAGTVFAIDAESQTVVRFESLTGVSTGTIPTPDLASGGPDGLAATGSSLYFVNAIGSNLIHEVDASTGAGIDAFAAPFMAGGTDGLAFMDGFLYTLDPAADTVFKVDQATGETVSSCSTGMFAVGGLAAEDGRLFAILGLTSVVELDPDTCAVLGGPFAAPNGDFLLGLAFDGTDLFASTYFSPAVHTMDPDTGAVLDSFSTGFLPSGLASSAAAPVTALDVDVDVMPNKCNNQLNVNSAADFRVVVHGSDDLDVGQIDVSSVTFEGMEPLRTVYRDRGAPGSCQGVPDGHLDLILVFSAADLVAAFRSADLPMHNGLKVTVHVQGSMHDGQSFVGTDEVQLKSNPMGNGNPNDKSGRSRRGLTR